MNRLSELHANAVDFLCINQQIPNLFAIGSGSGPLAENHQTWWLRVPKNRGIL